MDLIGFCGIAILTAILAILLHELGVQKHTVIIGGGTLLFAYYFTRLHAVRDFLEAWIPSGGGEYSGVLLKGLGICLAVEISAGICRECGAELAARALVMLGRVEILLLALPLLRRLTEMMGGLV